MKLRNKIVALFLTVACAFGLAVAGNATKVSAEETTYSHTLVGGDFASNKTTSSLSGVNWTVSMSGSTFYGGLDSNGRGFQFGKSKEPAKSLSLTSDSFAGITNISIETAGASSINANLIVYVGETAVGSYKLTSTSTKKDFEVDALTGPVCFSYTNSSAKAIYVKSISIVYGAGEQAPKSDAEKVAEAKEALNLSSTSVISSFELLAIGSNAATIKWESDNSAIKVIGTKAVVTRPVEDTVVNLTATLTVGEAIETKNFEVTVKGLGRKIVTEPQVDTLYKLVVSQGANNLVNYVNGSMANTYYFATSTSASAGKNVHLVAVEGGFHLVMGDKYINVVASGTHINAVYEDAPSSVWTFDYDYNTLVTVLSGTTYCLQSDGTYNTVDPATLGSAEYIAQLVELTEEETIKAMGVKVGFQVGTKDESKALRLVAAFDFAAEEVANFDKEISFRVTHNDVADERVVTTLYSSVNPMNDEEVLEDGYYAVLTYVNVPAGEYLVEVLVNGVVAATVTATVA